MTVHAARPKDAGHYDSNGRSYCFDDPPTMGKDIVRDCMVHPYFHGMDVREIAALVERSDDEVRKYLDAFGENHPHEHYTTRQTWLRAAILGSYDGLVSISSLLMGVAAGYSGAEDDAYSTIVLTGISGIIAGSLSMSIGEYTSVQSQRESERADVQREIDEQEKGPMERKMELIELAKIWRSRGLSPRLACEVAIELSTKEAWKSHARDELNIDVDSFADPLSAALASMLSFLIGGSIPLIAFIMCPRGRELALLISTGGVLALLGAFFAMSGGSNIWFSTFRMVFAGLVALSVTYGAGRLMA